MGGNRQHVDAALVTEALKQTMTEGFVVHDAQGFVIDCNASAVALLGLTRDQLLGLSSLDPRWEALEPDGSPLPGERHPAMVALREGREVRDHVFAVHATGFGRRWLSVTASPIRNEAGQVIGAVAVFSSADDRMLISRAPFGYHSVDPDGCFLDVNDTELQWLGRTRAEVVGVMRLTDVLTADGRETFARNFPRLKAGESVDELELEVVHRSGSRRQVRASVKAIVDSAGVFMRSQSVMVDISELRRIEARARSMLREQQAMLDNDLVGIVRLRRRTVTWANRAMHRMFGYPPGDMVGRSAREIYPSDAAFSALGEEAYPVIDAGGIYRGRIPLRRREGGEIHCDMSGVLVDAPSGESMWLLLDISELEREHARVKHLALHDALTDLPNRQLLGNRIEFALARIAREGGCLALCFLDLDGFKPINDQHGHAGGDQLLKQVAQRLLSCVRPNDTVARVGGDEFVLVLTELSGRDIIVDVIERLRQSIALPLTLAGGETVTIGCSFGVAVAPDMGLEKGRLLRLADQAMYRAKEVGGNRVEWAGDAPPDALAE